MNDRPQTGRELEAIDLARQRAERHTHALERIADALDRLVPGEDDFRQHRRRLRAVIRRYWSVIEKGNAVWKTKVLEQVAAAYDGSLMSLEERVVQIERMIKDMEKEELRRDDERLEQSERRV